MTFKKDYINYLLQKAIYGANGEFKDIPELRRLADKIIEMDDVVKITYLIGKTAGLEGLFKYMLYISDKIDKSQVSIFNLKDNFEYDLRNIIKICRAITEYNKGKEKLELDADKISSENADIMDVTAVEEETEADQETEAVLQEDEKDDVKEGMTLIENYDNTKGEGDVFELENISDTVENTGIITETDAHPGDVTVDEQAEAADQAEKTGITNADTGKFETDEIVTDEPADEQVQVPEIEIEVKKPVISDSYTAAGEQVKEESVTNEAYLKFENRFFEEVKILEKLFATVNKEIKSTGYDKLGEKILQSLTEIIEISSELSNLSRQLMFDLIADIFLTMNIYFTKAISSPALLESEKIKLFDSSLALVNSLIKGEDYLNYDIVIDKIEKLKKEFSGKEEEQFKEEAEDIIPVADEKQEEDDVPVIIEQPRQEIKKAVPKGESEVFKLKYLVKEFEKSFISISGFKGEYSRFEAHEKISELNNALRLIAKISSGLKKNDVLRLAEVTYVFLKYLKDYRIDMIDPEIQQIVKYIIFTFKMLLTGRRPDDFNILVQHLNNPVRIFTDS